MKSRYLRTFPFFMVTNVRLRLHLWCALAVDSCTELRNLWLNVESQRPSRAAVAFRGESDHLMAGQITVFRQRESIPSLDEKRQNLLHSLFHFKINYMKKIKIYHIYHQLEASNTLLNNGV